MKLDQFRDYTDRLVNMVKSDTRVIGLVAAGSMAEGRRIPDEWSDHDFFLVVQTGYQEHFRTTFDWLPDAARIVFTIRETKHGLKVMYDLPHLIEYAVFDMDEVRHIKLNDYHILIGDAALAEKVAQQQVSSTNGVVDEQRELLMVLALLYVGAGRAARGEDLSAHVFIKHHLLHHLLPLLLSVTDTQSDTLDSLDVFRRLEQALPDAALQIRDALLLPNVSCAQALLRFVVEITTDHVQPYPQAAINVVRDYLATIQHHLAT